MKTCFYCDKNAIPGIKYKRRGMIRRKGGAGSKIVGKAIRRFFPNLQRLKVNIGGTVCHVQVCTSCIQAGVVTKA